MMARRDVLAEVETAISSVSRPGLAELLWNWRYELLTAAGLAGPLTAIGLTLGTSWLLATVATETILLAAALASPPARRRLIARAWCVITSHRIRTGCKHAWVQSRDGRFPVVVRIRPATFGESALVWCRAGIVPDDLAAARDVISTTCWAHDVRVIANQRRRHLVTLEVIRRGPLDATQQTWPYLTQREDSEEPATAA
jgi:hypothetical protein